MKHGRNTLSSSRTKKTVAVLLTLLAAEAARAEETVGTNFSISTGCVAINSTALYVNSTTITDDFSAGEVLVVAAAPSSLTPGNGVVDTTAGVDILAVSAEANTRSANYTIPATGNRTFTITTSESTDNIVIGCVPVDFTNLLEEQQIAAERQSQSSSTLRSSTSQVAGLVAGRTSGFSGGSNSRRIGGRSGSTGQQTAVVIHADPGLVDLSAGRKDGAAGAAAGDGLEGLGVWVNFAWAGIKETSAAAGTEGNSFTGVAGVDYSLTDKLLVGAAVSVSGSGFDSRTSDLETDEVSFGINPYLAYRLSDVWTIDAIAGLSTGSADSERSAGTIKGDYAVNRYFVATNISLLNEWERFAFTASGGMLWAQSFEDAFVESDGTQVGSRRSDLGTLRFSFQPSYLFDLDPETGLFLEPYLRGEFSYDIVMSKVNTPTGVTDHPNDRSAFVVGGGLNVFSDGFFSGNLEASTVVGREKYREVNVLGTVRMSF